MAKKTVARMYAVYYEIEELPPDADDNVKGVRDFDLSAADETAEPAIKEALMQSAADQGFTFNPDEFKFEVQKPEHGW